MAITAKELAQKLNISAAAVSMALNDKPGVSKETRKRIKNAAEKYGYDFSKIKEREIQNGHILFVMYMKNGAIVTDNQFFDEVYDGVKDACRKSGYKIKKLYIYDDEIESRMLEDIQYSDCIGLIILGTEISASELRHFKSLNIPMVLLDNYLEDFPCDCVLINNTQGACCATKYLIKKAKSQPGYLASSYPVNNFLERSEGFYKAIYSSGMSRRQSIVHKLTPSIDGAYNDMKELLDKGVSMADCYFADNDFIAAGAMKALQEYGYQIPKDIRIIGFDNLPLSRVLTPTLTTINVPKKAMGEEAVQRLVFRINNNKAPYTKTEMATELIDRYSC